MNQIKISVVVPVYNVEPYLRECIDSLVNQTLQEIEIICVNDGSTDDSLGILEEYEKKDQRVKVVSQENQGQGVARNTAMAMAQGEYLSFLDSDDYFTLTALEETYAKAKRLQLDILIFAVEGFDKNTLEPYPLNVFYKSENLPEKEVFTYEEMPDTIFTSFTFSVCNKIFRHDFIKEHNLTFPSLRKTEDIGFTARAFVKAKRMAGLPSRLIHYRTGNPLSTDSTLYLDPLAGYVALKDVMFFLKEASYPPSLQAHFSQVTLSFLAVFLDNAYHHVYALHTLYQQIKEHGEADFGIAKLGATKHQKNHFETYITIQKEPFEVYLHGLLMEKEGKEKYDLLRLIRTSYKNLSFFGAGVECRRMLTYFREHGIPDPVSICDNNPLAQNKLFWGVPVISFQDYLGKYDNKGILITCLVDSSQILRQVQGTLGEEDIFKVKL